MDRRTEMVARHEGYRQHIYRCSAGKLTIGYGLNISTGLPRDEAALLLEYRLNKIDEQLARSLPFYPRLSAIRQDVLCDMAYNLGVAGLMGFKRMLAALEAGDYPQASAEMLDSKWAGQVGQRAIELADLMRVG